MGLLSGLYMFQTGIKGMHIWRLLQTGSFRDSIISLKLDNQLKPVPGILNVLAWILPTSTSVKKGKGYVFVKAVWFTFYSDLISYGYNPQPASKMGGVSRRPICFNYNGTISYYPSHTLKHRRAAWLFSIPHPVNERAHTQQVYEQKSCSSLL